MYKKAVTFSAGAGATQDHELTDCPAGGQIGLWLYQVTNSGMWKIMMKVYHPDKAEPLVFQDFFMSLMGDQAGFLWLPCPASKLRITVRNQWNGTRSAKGYWLFPSQPLPIAPPNGIIFHNDASIAFGANVTTAAINVPAYASEIGLHISTSADVPGKVEYGPNGLLNASWGRVLEWAESERGGNIWLPKISNSILFKIYNTDGSDASIFQIIVTSRQ
jgi:hypothetical protein